jgi:hypothetical protein
MPRGFSPKRERQDEHIKASVKQPGESTGRAEELAGRTVNGAHGEQGTRPLRRGEGKPCIAPGHVPVGRGGQRSHRGAQGLTYAQLYSEACRRGRAGRR